MRELSRYFKERLEKYDRSLKAFGDDVEDAIVINAVRSNGMLVHELTVKRAYAESYEELENRTIAKLRESDVWKKYGSGEAYDDFLAEEERRHTESQKRALKSDREARFKDEIDLWKAAIWNAQHGRMTADEILPYNTAMQTVDREFKKEPTKSPKEEKENVTV